MVNNLTVKVGDKVLYRPSFGRGPQVEATVTGLEECECGEKYGYPVDEFSGDPECVTMDLDNGHWAYGTQVDKVLAQ